MLTISHHFHEHFMALALREAERSAEAGEVPCGCLIVQIPEAYCDPAIAHPPCLEDPWQGRIIAKGHNQREMLRDPTAHAEMIAITAATSALDAPSLNHCLVYITKEPCPMCAGALILARPEMIIWGLSDSLRGGESAFGILSSQQVNHRALLVKDILEPECKTQFQHFFKMRRKEKDV